MGGRALGIVGAILRFRAAIVQVVCEDVFVARRDAVWIGRAER